MIQGLTYELSVLSKAVQHKNLSAAASHVGLSQPQLSRLVAKIEQELNVMLLDRTARRKSGWTPIAQELTTTFMRGLGRLESEILSIAEERETHELRIATLEGLSAIAMQFAKDAFDHLQMKTINLDILDFRDLDAEFLSGNLDLIFTVRPPSKQKFLHMLEVGYQQSEEVSTSDETMVYSPFEYAGLDKKSIQEAKHILVSNSLSIRRNWLHDFGGTGALPVDAKKGKGKGTFPVLIIGSDLLSPRLWQKISDMMSD